jgi:hypothetical protein
VQILEQPCAAQEPARATNGLFQVDCFTILDLVCCEPRPRAAWLSCRPVVLGQPATVALGRMEPLSVASKLTGRDIRCHLGATLGVGGGGVGRSKIEDDVGAGSALNERDDNR